MVRDTVGSSSSHSGRDVVAWVNTLMERVVLPSLVASPQQSSRNAAVTQVTLVAAAVAASTVVFLQMGTNGNPIGRCWTFWKQLGKQVRSCQTCT